MADAGAPLPKVLTLSLDQTKIVVVSEVYV